jgi:hypothetical protein
MCNLTDVREFGDFKSAIINLLNYFGKSAELLNCKDIEMKYSLVPNHDNSQIIDKYKDDEIAQLLIAYYFACEALRIKTNK